MMEQTEIQFKVLFNEKTSTINFVISYFLFALAVVYPFTFPFLGLDKSVINFTFFIGMMFIPLVILRLLYIYWTRIFSWLSTKLSRSLNIELNGEELFVFTLRYASIVFLIYVFNLIYSSIGLSFLIMSSSLLFILILNDIREFMIEKGASWGSIRDYIIGTTFFAPAVMYFVLLNIIRIGKNKLLDTLNPIFSGFIQFLGIIPFIYFGYKLFRKFSKGEEVDIHRLFNMSMFLGIFAYIPLLIIFEIIAKGLTEILNIILLPSLIIFFAILFTTISQELHIFNEITYLYIYLTALLTYWGYLSLLYLAKNTFLVATVSFFALVFYSFIALIVNYATYKRSAPYIVGISLLSLGLIEYIYNPSIFAFSLVNFNSFLMYLAKIGIIIGSIVLISINMRIDSVKQYAKELEKTVEQEEELQPKLKSYIFNLKTWDKDITKKLTGEYIKERLDIMTTSYIISMFQAIFLIILILNIPNLLVLINPKMREITIIFWPQFSFVIFLVFAVILILSLKTENVIEGKREENANV